VLVWSRTFSISDFARSRTSQSHAPVLTENWASLTKAKCLLEANAPWRPSIEHQVQESFNFMQKVGSLGLQFLYCVVRNKAPYSIVLCTNCKMHLNNSTWNQSIVLFLTTWWSCRQVIAQFQIAKLALKRLYCYFPLSVVSVNLVALKRFNRICGCQNFQRYTSGFDTYSCRSLLESSRNTF